MPRKRNDKTKRFDEPTFAPGMDIDHQLKQDASEEEVKEGDYTEVTTLSLDETDPR
ncbi:hypothetical protein [Alkalihalobacillus sp. AL-G]|uniref:hypothetical protein n=1 Tax=Alkalihalobacillus sp. AL-G TaxID=2926399 RepID=UPI00272A4F32|nr:hypothetical protein [Alkalihalobacillus sp. AL-G]WLD93249.1 hypothetical protein MOJ78_20010 [Alkalihalobacillus sp. AL-G]